MGTLTSTESLTAGELLTYVETAVAEHLHGLGLSVDDLVDHPEVVGMALNWADHLGGPNPGVGAQVLADLIAAGPTEWQRGVL